MEEELPKLERERGITMGFTKVIKNICLVGLGAIAGRYVTRCEMFKRAAFSVIDELEARNEPEKKDEVITEEPKPKKTPSRKKKTTEVPETTEEEP
jgi:hypothetical protein